MSFRAMGVVLGLMLSLSTMAQTQVSFPLGSMFGGSYTGSFACNAKTNTYTDGTNIYFGTRYATNCNAVTNLIVPLQPNNYWVQSGVSQQGFGFFLPSGLGTGVVNVLTLVTTNLYAFTNYTSTFSTNGGTAGQVLTINPSVPLGYNYATPASGGGFTPSANQTNVLNYGVTNNNAGNVALRGTLTINDIVGGGGNITIGGAGDTITIDGSDNGVPWTLGAGGTVYDGSCVTIGFDAETLGTTAVAVGALAVAAYDAVAVGDAASAPQQDDVAVGSYATVATTAKQSIAIGTETLATQPYSIVIGAQNFGYKTLLGGTLQVGGAPQPPSYQLTNAELGVQAVTGSVTNTLQIQSTNGAIVLSVNSNNVIAFNASALTNLAAANLSGTVPAAALPQTQTWTNGTILYVNALGQLGMTNPATRAHFLFGTNGHFSFVDQFSNSFMFTTNTFGYAPSNGAAILLYSNGSLSIGGNSLLTNAPATNGFITQAQANLAATNAALNATNAGAFNITGNSTTATLATNLVSNPSLTNAVLQGGVWMTNGAANTFYQYIGSTAMGGTLWTIGTSPSGISYSSSGASTMIVGGTVAASSYTGSGNSLTNLNLASIGSTGSLAGLTLPISISGSAGSVPLSGLPSAVVTNASAIILTNTAGFYATSNGIATAIINTNGSITVSNATVTGVITIGGNMTGSSGTTISANQILGNFIGNSGSVGQFASASVLGSSRITFATNLANIYALTNDPTPGSWFILPNNQGFKHVSIAATLSATLPTGFFIVISNSDAPSPINYQVGTNSATFTPYGFTEPAITGLTSTVTNGITAGPYSPNSMACVTNVASSNPLSVVPNETR